MGKKQSGFIKALNYLDGKGFYIILFLCVLSIGISGYVLFFAGDDEPDPVELPYLAGLPEEDGGENPYEIPPLSPAVQTEDAEDGGKQALQEQTPLQSDETPEKGQAESAVSSGEAEEGKTASVMRPQQAEEQEKPTVCRPVRGKVIAPFSEDVLVYSPTMGDWRVHRGTDFAAEVGEQVMAIMGGEVSAVYTDEIYGRCVRVLHEDGLETLYTGLMEQVTVSQGDRVAAGDVLGGVGESALLEAAEETRLHVEFYRDGAPANLESILPAQ